MLEAWARRPTPVGSGDTARGNRDERPDRPQRRRIVLREPEKLRTVYAIGDVHGCLRELQDAEQRIVADAQEKGRPALVVLLGDFVDRGPDSAGVLDHLQEPLPKGLRRICLAGNHEEEMLRFLDDPATAPGWIDSGGAQTLQSYGIRLSDLERRRRSLAECMAEAARAVPDLHKTFLRDLPAMLKCGDYLFVHAGLRPGVPLVEQTDTDLTRIREPFLSEGPRLPVTVVHGHVPALTPSFGVQRIGIDTAAYATGNLTVLRIRDGRHTVL